MIRPELLNELEGMTHDARMRRMAELGSRVGEDPTVRPLLEEMEQGAFYERWLSLQSCYGSRDGNHALRGLLDPSRTIRGLAVTLIPHVCSNVEAEQALHNALPYQLPLLFRRLLRRRRRAPIDAYLLSLALPSPDLSSTSDATGAQEQAPAHLPPGRLSSLLRFGSPELVLRFLEEVMPAASAVDWRGLARHHPRIAARALQSQAEAASNFDPRLFWTINSVLPLLAKSVPDQALDLVRTLQRHTSLGLLDLQQLAGRRPLEMADLVLASEEQVSISFNRVAHRLPLDRLLGLIDRHWHNVSEVYLWLRRLSPLDRRTVFNHCRHGLQDTTGRISYQLVALLPADLREQEGRRHLELSALATRPPERLQYAAFLPWEEACQVLEGYIRNPDPELRALALRVLAFAGRYHRDRLGDLLTMMRARRNEQDPVRGAMLTGLAGLPPGAWKREHLQDLGQIIREALDAADLSGTTAAAAEQLVVALLPFHPDWSVSWLAVLVSERGHLSSYNLEQRLSEEEVRRLAPALLPVARSWSTRERESALVGLARSLGRRLKVFDGLADLLEDLARNSASHMGAWALQLLAYHRRERAASLIPELLKSDPSWVTQPVVYNYLHRRRQDLLTPFLGQKAYKGRFSTGKTRFVLPISEGFYRWTPTQQATFASTLEAVIRDRERDIPSLLFAVNQLAALPAVPPDTVIFLAREDQPKPAVRDGALRALGRLDAGQGAPALLEAMGDDRARIAIYVLRGALLEMPVERAISLLRSMPLDRVTVAKEVVRLMGDLPSHEAYIELLAMDRRELHRDVRVALLRALWSHLDQEESWTILEQAANSPDPALAASTARIPAERLSLTAQRRLVALLAGLLRYPDPKVRMDTLQRCAQLPVADPDRVMLEALTAAMGSSLPDECAAASGAVFATYAGHEAAAVGQAVENILENRRALHTSVEALRTAVYWSRGRLLPAVQAVLDAMARDPLTAILRIELAASALPWQEVAGLLQRMAAQEELHAGVLAAGIQAIESTHLRPDTRDLGVLESTLFTSPDERLRRLALAALQALSAAPRGWNEERSSRLESYRRDPSPLVASTAQFLFPPEDKN